MSVDEEWYTPTDEDAEIIHLAWPIGEAESPAPEIVGSRYMTGRDFLEADFPSAEVLLGDPESVVVLTRGSFLLVYGEGGSAKTTLSLDAMAHLCAGRDWLGLRVPRPLNVLVIENEGTASLFQALLRRKAERFDADPSWLERVTVYAGPWGGFTFNDPEQRARLLAACAENEIDLVICNPLLGVGGPGAGRPDETQAFTELLKELGLWKGGPGFWLIHHANKLNDVSGDWARLPDTLVHLQRVGDEEMSALTWTKTRLVFGDTSGFPRKLLLAWDIPNKTFTITEGAARGASEEDILAAIDAYLTEHPASSTRAIRENVAGRGERISDLLAEGAEDGRYVCVNGPRGARLYSLAGAHLWEAS